MWYNEGSITRLPISRTVFSNKASLFDHAVQIAHVLTHSNNNDFSLPPNSSFSSTIFPFVSREVTIFNCQFFFFQWATTCIRTEFIWCQQSYDKQYLISSTRSINVFSTDKGEHICWSSCSAFLFLTHNKTWIKY